MTPNPSQDTAILGDKWKLATEERWFRNVDESEPLIAGFHRHGLNTLRLARYL
mgnify:FL=1